AKVLYTTMAQQSDQRMILAPRKIQSMEILQLPNMALQEPIQQELQENPVLEVKETPTDEAAAETETEETAASNDEPAQDVTDPETELVIDEKESEIDFDRLEALS